MSLFGKKYPDNKDDDACKEFEDVYAGPGMMGETGYNDPDAPEDPDGPDEPETPEPEPVEKPVKPPVMNRPKRTITGKVYAGPGMIGGDVYDPEPEYRSVYAGPPVKKQSWIKRLFSRKK